MTVAPSVEPFDQQGVRRESIRRRYYALPSADRDVINWRRIKGDDLDGWETLLSEAEGWPKCRHTL